MFYVYAEDSQNHFLNPNKLKCALRFDSAFGVGNLVPKISEKDKVNVWIKYAFRFPPLDVEYVAHPTK